MTNILYLQVAVMQIKILKCQGQSMVMVVNIILTPQKNISICPISHIDWNKGVQSVSICPISHIDWSMFEMLLMK